MEAGCQCLVVAPVLVHLVRHVLKGGMVLTTLVEEVGPIYVRQPYQAPILANGAVVTIHVPILALVWIFVQLQLTQHALINLVQIVLSNFSYYGCKFHST